MQWVHRSTGRVPRVEWWFTWYRDWPWEFGIEWRRSPFLNPTCYCKGSTDRVLFKLFRWRLRVEVARDPVKRPCTCTKITWLLFPENHEEEIEDYGLERLQRELPDV